MTYHDLDIVRTDSVYVLDAQQDAIETLVSAPVSSSTNPLNFESTAVDSSVFANSDVSSAQVFTDIARSRLDT